MITLRVLGPLQVARNGRVVRLPGPRETALLGLLAARYPQDATSGELVEGLWGAEPPGGADTTLRSYVSTLRRALQAGGEDRVVLTRHGGYALSPSVGEALDARLFESLLRHAERLRAAGELDARIRALDLGLRLWRGPAFAEVCSSPGIAPYAGGLDEARLVATEQWAEARLQAGASADLASELAPLCRENPLREQLWGLRMLALYRSGRQVEALEVYRELRGLFREQLGLEPGRALRALELAILRQDESLERPAREVSPDSRRGVRQPALAPGARLVPPPSFVGRDPELDALEVALVLALDGGTNPVFIAGEPGIGKSSLVAAFADRLAGRGATVLSGQCQSGTPLPYQPLREVVAPLLAAIDRRAETTSGLDLTGWAAGGLDSVAAAATGTGNRQQDPETARLWLFDAVCEVVLRAAQDAPLVIVLEDLHWADASSLLLLRHLVRRSRAARILIVATYRDTEAEGSDLNDALADLGIDPGLTTLRLSGLSEGELLALLSGSPRPLGGPDPIGLASMLRRATEGNPLFVRQMLAQLAVTPDAFLTATGALRASPPLPAGVHDAIARRLAPLEPETVSALVLAAVIGTDFELDLLAAASDGHDVLAAVEQALRAGLVLEQPGGAERYRFAHELVRQSIVDQVSRARRARLHQRVAEALERLAGEHPDSLPALAEHFAAAARPGHTDKAVAYALAAGGQALRALAFAEAAAIAARGLECLKRERQPDIEQHCELWLLLAEARLLARDIQGCKQAAACAGDDARERRSISQLSRAAIIASHLNTFGRPSELTRELCADALEAIGDGDPVATAQVLAGFADYIASSEGDAPAAEKLSRRALALARASNDSAALARAIFVHGEVLGWTPSIEERLALASELNELATAHDDPRAEASALHISALARLESGDVPGFDADLVRIESLRQRLDYWYIDVFALLWRGMRALMDGRYEVVEQNANELLAHARHEPNVVNLYAGQLSWLRREQGRLGELRPLVEDAIKHSPDVIGFRCGLALICSDLGELDQAAGHLEHLAADDFAALPRDATWTTSLTLLAEVAAAVGDRARARALSELLFPFSGRLIVCTKGMVCAGAADRYLGLLAATDENWEQSDRYFRSALALEASIEAPILIARTNACFERALRA